MCDANNVLDKDGISAMCVAAEMCVYLKTIGRTLYEQLNTISLLYGYHINNNSYLYCNKTDVLLNIFDRLRHFDQDKHKVNNDHLEFSDVKLLCICRAEVMHVNNKIQNKKLSFNIRIKSNHI